MTEQISGTVKIHTPESLVAEAKHLIEMHVISDEARTLLRLCVLRLAMMTPVNARSVEETFHHHTGGTVAQGQFEHG